MTRTCGRCGASYDGWNCPVCKQLEALEQHAKAVQGAAQLEAEARLRAAEIERQARLRAVRQEREALEEHVRNLRQLELERQQATQQELRQFEFITSHVDELQAATRVRKAWDLLHANLPEEALLLCQS